GQDSARVLELAFLNSRCESGLKSPLDEAILSEPVDMSAWRKLDELPFDFERRRVSVLACRGDDPPLLVAKGAFEDILRASAEVEGPDGKTRPLDCEQRAALQGRFEALGREGFRVLGVAWKAQPAGCSEITRTDEDGLVFAGFLAFQDPPKG